jgi:hypothetical protein
MLNNHKTYKRVLSLCFSILAYLFLSLSAKAQIKLLVDSNAVKTFSGQQSKDGIEYVDIYLMSSFDDSVIISIEQRNIFNKSCKTDHVLGQAASVTTLIPKDGDVLTIYCFNEKLKQAILFKRGYACLYVWKISGKFQFEFTNKIRWLE